MSRSLLRKVTEWRPYRGDEDRTNTVRLFINAATTTGANPALANSTFGAGCKAATRTSPLAASGTSQIIWATGSGNLIVHGTDAPASAPMVTLLGLRDTSFGMTPTATVDGYTIYSIDR